MNVVVAIDAGTTGVRAIAFGHDGLVVGSAHREFPQHFPAPGWVEHDTDEIGDALDTVCAELSTRLEHHRIVAIGITDQRETIVAW
ncbi:MAG: glycerol kinase, partial [Acidimicrobiia bacterium]|nr:glycerol kinase [Acidimicrobiia bacterium]